VTKRNTLNRFLPHAVGEVRWGSRDKLPASSCGETPTLILPHDVGEEIGFVSSDQRRARKRLRIR